MREALATTVREYAFVDQGAPVDADIAALIPIICAPHTPWPCEWAINTTGCESGYRSDAIGFGGLFWGLWQIDYWWPEWADPVSNTEAAIAKWNGSVDAGFDGRRPWPHCGRNGW